MAREMKDSGVEWIGEIPKDWKVLRNKNCFTLRKEIVGNSFEEYDLLSLTKLGIKIKDKNDFKGKVPENYGTYQNVKKGELVLCLFDLDCSAVFSGLSEYEGMISPAYKVYNCKKNIFNNFARYWFEYCFIERKYKIYSKSLRYVVNSEDFGGIEILVPLLEEQEKIANYLDKKVTDIDLIIEKTKVTIEDYKKYKQSIITEAVTKGLNPNIEMKDSGIEWIGQIPKHWEVTKLKNITNLSRGIFGHRPRNDPKYYNGDYPFIQTGDVASANKYIKYFSQTLSELGKGVSKEFKKGTIAFTLAANVGDVAILDFDSYFPDSVMAIIPKNKVSNIYLYYILSVMKKEFFRVAIVSTQLNLNVERVGNIYISFPKLEEQQQIAEYLDKKVTDIDNLIAKKESLISEMEEYKKSLIYECVTGKKEIVLSENKIIPFIPKTKNLQFAKAVLIAKIADELNGKKGKVAIAKILYLIETHLSIEFNSIIERQVAGPLDSEFYKAESILKKDKWFKIKKLNYLETYTADEKKDDYKKYYVKYFGQINDKIENIIDKLKNLSTEKLEMIATMYASINDFKIKNQELDKEKIIEDIFSWNKSKERFSKEKWLEVFETLNNLDLIPNGYGKSTIKK